MRFLFTLPYYEWTGPAQPMAELAQDLEALGHEVTIWVEGKRSGDLVDRLKALDLRVETPLELSRKSSPVGLLKDLRRAGKQAKGRFDLAVAHMSADQLILCQSRRWHGVPVIRYAQNEDSLEPSPTRGWLIRQADGYLVPSQAHAQMLQERFRVPQSRSQVLSGAVDLAHFQPGENTEVRKRWGLTTDQLALVSVSRMKVERRQGLLLKALARVAQERTDLRLILVGRGEYQSELRTMVEDLAISHCVHFAGYALGDELVHAYQAADVTVWLAEGNDGTCRAIGQSLACGRAVLGSRFGAIEEAIQPGMNGWLVEPDDQGELEAALRALPQRSDLPDPLVLRGQAETYWSRERRCQRFLGAVEALQL